MWKVASASKGDRFEDILRCVQEEGGRLAGGVHRQFPSAKVLNSAPENRTRKGKREQNRRREPGALDATFRTVQGVGYWPGLAACTSFAQTWLDVPAARLQFRLLTPRVCALAWTQLSSCRPPPPNHLFLQTRGALKRPSHAAPKLEVKPGIVAAQLPAKAGGGSFLFSRARLLFHAIPDSDFLEV